MVTLIDLDFAVGKLEEADDLAKTPILTLLWPDTEDDPAMCGRIVGEKALTDLYEILGQFLGDRNIPTMG